MGYEVKILRDSLSDHGIRLTTVELTYPRFVHAEFMTHRVFSRNSASSRAIPVEKLIQRVVDDPVIPVYWGKNQKGMQAEVELEGKEKEAAIKAWLEARDSAVVQANRLKEMGIHKQLVNRLIEPWMWITVICTATEFGNFFNLRCHKAAQPEIKRLADMLADEYFTHQPTYVPVGGWHLPLLKPEDLEALPLEDQKAASAAKCARVSYLTHAGTRDVKEDIRLHEQLRTAGHMSPFEHVAQAMSEPEWEGNFRGWKQYRKDLPDENRPEFDYQKYKEEQGT